MKIPACAIITFFVAMLVHMAIWRVCLPKKDRAAVLAGIFLWTLVPGIMILRGMPGIVDYAVLYCCLAAAYIVSYPAMEADSPSLAIVNDIAAAGASGIDKEALYNKMTDETLVIARIRDLLDDGLIRADRGRYILTKKGRLMAGIFSQFRKILNAPKGG